MIQPFGGFYQLLPCVETRLRLPVIWLFCTSNDGATIKEPRNDKAPTSVLALSGDGLGKAGEVCENDLACRFRVSTESNQVGRLKKKVPGILGKTAYLASGNIWGPQSPRRWH